ncbi:kinase-like domain-containing protein [Russula earlei]|uniref:Kinase-like domain-containing protein n=1 Tax=Russula earlei TaxID=71964 RepID=A0ACC0TZ35_9AGAM|nr:kinase-like domain-containing protein [Russula earlei]
MQTKRSSYTYPVSAPLPGCPRIFTQTLAVPNTCEDERSFTCASTSSGTYVPTIPRVFIPRTPPPSPAAAVELIGPVSPVIRSGKRQFRVEGLIATGAYGRVALANAVGPARPEQFAIKVFCKDRLIAEPWLLEMYDLERRIMVENTRQNCQWLVQLKGMFGDLWNRYLVMDYYPNTLAGVIFDSACAPLPKKIVRLWVEELTLAMYELYNRQIVHCDLKPGNILVSSKGHLAVADFGISHMPDPCIHGDKPFDECTFFAYGGTYAYQAPELLISHDRANFTCAVDMWSFGVIIYEMYTGKRLFSADVDDVRNEVWVWDVPAIVRKEIDDELTQDLVIEVCGSF